MPSGRATIATALATSVPVLHSNAHKVCSSPPLVPTASSSEPSGEKARAQIEFLKQGCGALPPAPPPSGPPSAAVVQPTRPSSRSVARAHTVAYAAVFSSAEPSCAVATLVPLGCSAMQLISWLWPSKQCCSPLTVSRTTASRPAGYTTDAKLAPPLPPRLPPPLPPLPG